MPCNGTLKKAICQRILQRVDLEWLNGRVPDFYGDWTWKQPRSNGKQEFTAFVAVEASKLICTAISIITPRSFDHSRPTPCRSIPWTFRNVKYVATRISSGRVTSPQVSRSPSVIEERLIGWVVLYVCTMLFFGRQHMDYAVTLC